MGENWKEEYAYKFRRPFLKKDYIITCLKEIVQNLDTEVKKFDKTLEIVFKPVDENNFEINLPNADVIIVKYSEAADNPNFKEKFNLSINKDKLKTIELYTKNDSCDYFIKYINIDKHKGEAKRIPEIDNDILDNALNLLLI